ncbi:hypothetical protein B4U80_07822 [Leptotrombidium deliense]|uniref:Uncharacterized protein n=1 Tax=Leptotrombidium deliense TaxID=299467 RepID=A0A443QDM1_9ACAR|nr:hypothetical protein B4U80_07822 [Leptotrombidium deliense]
MVYTVTSKLMSAFRIPAKIMQLVSITVRGLNVFVPKDSRESNVNTTLIIGCSMHV